MVIASSGLLILLGACKSELAEQHSQAAAPQVEVSRVCGEPISGPSRTGARRATRDFLLREHAFVQTFIGVSAQTVWVREPNFDFRSCDTRIVFTGEAGAFLPSLSPRMITDRDEALRQQKIDKCERLGRFIQRRRYGLEVFRAYSETRQVDTGDFVGCEILVDNYSVAFRISWGDTHVDVLSAFDETFVMSVTR